MKSPLPFLATAFLTIGTVSALEPLAPPLVVEQQDPDAALVLSLLGENLGNRRFAFSTVVNACSGKSVVPLGDKASHQRVTAAIRTAISQTIAELNQPDSPVRKLRRINEASRLFEDGIHARIEAMPGLKCDIPPNRAGAHQRSGYPDLRITDGESGDIFYLDPKLVEAGSLASTLRSFYFEPKNETLKITDDAVHLLAGIEHDGKEGEWTFSGYRLVDLSKLKVRLKAEFQAANADVYKGTELTQPEAAK